MRESEHETACSSSFWDRHRQFLLECLLAKTHTRQGTDRDGQARSMLGGLAATITQLIEAADSNH